MKSKTALRKVAVIVSGIDEEYQNTNLKGIHAYAEEHGVHVVHFVAFGGTLCSEHHDVGEYNIYNLCQYNDFDGVILFINTISDSVSIAEIVKNLWRCRVPVICVDNDLDSRFYYVGIDNFNAMQNIVRHIVHDHHCKKVAYISGPKSNSESIQRYYAYESVMREAGLEIDPNLIYYGSFSSCDGVDGINYFLAHNEVQPDAIICANDVIALATILVLDEHGIRVPEDIMVTGFDNIYAARNFFPAITSVSRPLFQSGYHACKTVLEAKPDTPHSVILKTKMELRQSCGCGCHAENKDEVDKDERTFRKNVYQQLNYYQVNVPFMTRMSYVLAESESFAQSLENLKIFVKESGCDRFYLCLGEGWNNQRIEKTEDGQKVYFAESYISHGYAETMQVPLALTNGIFTDLPSFPSKQMLPDCELKYDTPTLYYMMPLHFQDQCFGYCIFCGAYGAHFNIENSLIHTWVMNVANSLENIRKKEHLDQALAEMNALYVKDSLCGINNRNGFDKYTADVFETCQAENRTCMMMFIDMDRLKYVNDVFSHKEGDNALYQLSCAIKKSCKNGEVPARFGGDEFIVFATNYSEEQAQALSDAIHKGLKKYNSISGKAYEVDASIGWYVMAVSEEDTLSELITAADKKMYEEKKTEESGENRIKINSEKLKGRKYDGYSIDYRRITRHWSVHRYTTCQGWLSYCNQPLPQRR
ncbi:MAG: GGDEF domain-containing protein [Ruminococcus sp.]|nr:GGDEF domain-containing protein [Ruminococcus sp.]